MSRHTKISDFYLTEKFVRALFFIEHLRWLLLPNDVPVTLNHPPAKENLKLKLINV